MGQELGSRRRTSYQRIHARCRGLSFIMRESIFQRSTVWRKCPVSHLNLIYSIDTLITQLCSSFRNKDMSFIVVVRPLDILAE